MLAWVQNTPLLFDGTFYFFKVFYIHNIFEICFFEYFTSFD